MSTTFQPFAPCCYDSIIIEGAEVIYALDSERAEMWMHNAGEDRRDLTKEAWEYMHANYPAADKTLRVKFGTYFREYDMNAQ